jgi:hypothetical protein
VRRLKWTVGGTALVAVAVLAVVGFAGAAVRADPGPAPGAVPTSQGVSITIEVSGSPSPSPTTSTGGGSGNLPRTGEQLALVGGIGLGLLAIGAAVRVLARRRTVGAMR